MDVCSRFEDLMNSSVRCFCNFEGRRVSRERRAWQLRSVCSSELPRAAFLLYSRDMLRALPARPVAPRRLLPKQASVCDTLALAKLVHLRGAVQLAARPCNIQQSRGPLAAA